MLDVCTLQESETTSPKAARTVVDSGAPGIREQGPAWGKTGQKDRERQRVKQRQIDETPVRMTGRERERDGVYQCEVREREPPLQ